MIEPMQNPICKCAFPAWGGERFVALMASLLFGACAVTGPALDPRMDLDSHLLLAELSQERGQYGEAVRHYLEAALISNNPKFAELTTDMALRADLPSAGLRAVRRWLELDGEVNRAHLYMGVFRLRLGEASKALAAFTAFVEGAEDAAAAVARSMETLAEEPDADGAIAIARGLAEANPDIAEAHYGLARLALRRGDYDMVLTHSGLASDLSPEWTEARMFYARSLLLTGGDESGLALARQLATDEPRLEVRLRYAELLLSTGRAEEARDLLGGILDESPGLTEAIRALAFLALSDGELDESRARFNEIRTDPRFRDEAFYYLGRIAEMRERRLKAMRHYSRVVEGRHVVDAQLRVAQLLNVNLNDPDGALRHLREFGKANPRYVTDMLLARGEILVRLGRESEAVELLGEELRRSPDDDRLHDANVQLHLILAQNAVKGERYGEARRVLNRALNSYPGNPSVRYAKALLFQERGWLRRAASELRRLVDDYPEDAGYLNALGYLLTDELGRHDEALPYLRKALAVEPDNPAIIDSMGWVLFHLGELESALEYLERAFALFPDPEVAAHVVDTHWALGNRDRALELLRDSLQEHADSEHLLEVRQRLAQ